VVLGAGLDTFAYRNPFPSLRVFEVDFPATQQWKRSMLREAAIALPENLTFVPLDLEHKALAEGLAEAGFDGRQPAFFGWLGVVPYLTLDAFRSTLGAIAQLPSGTGVCFDYTLSPATLSPARQKVFRGLQERLAAAGEPIRLFFTPEELESELRGAGFHRAIQVGSRQLTELYFQSRADGLKLSGAGLSMLAAAWV
jgi:methyltransferase (TIGR00027 family)